MGPFRRSLHGCRQLGGSSLYWCVGCRWSGVAADRAEGEGQQVLRHRRPAARSIPSQHILRNMQLDERPGKAYEAFGLLATSKLSSADRKSSLCSMRFTMLAPEMIVYSSGIQKSQKWRFSPLLDTDASRITPEASHLRDQAAA